MGNFTFKTNKKKLVAQVALLVVSLAVIAFGAYRGAAQTVLTKALNLCLEDRYTYKNTVTKALPHYSKMSEV